MTTDRYTDAPPEQRSSVETSTRGVDITVKAYVGSPIREAGSAAVDEFFRVRAEYERRLMGGAAYDWAMSNAATEERAIREGE